MGSLLAKTFKEVVAPQDVFDRRLDASKSQGDARLVRELEDLTQFG